MIRLLHPRSSLQLLCLGSSALLLAGCGEHDSHDDHDHGHDKPGLHSKTNDKKPEGKHGHDDHDGHNEEENSVRFSEGRGLQLTSEVAEAIGLQTATISEHALTPEQALTARIYAISPTIRAGSRVPASLTRAYDLAAIVSEGGVPSGRLAQVDVSAQNATGFVELIFDLDSGFASRSSRPPAIGDFVKLRITGKSITVPAVPATAMLDTAGGSFVYVLRDGYYMRTPVRTGLRTTAFVEIAEGLRPGESIAVSPIEQLWLTELRLTRGGGHSH